VPLCVSVCPNGALVLVQHENVAIPVHSR
jgi:Fe-S-cluster-containing hydrogenase component 2